jgi:hypothetical protein
MGINYCEYNGIRQEVDEKNGKLFITSVTKKDNFENFVDIFGNIYPNFYMKYLDLDEIDDLYNEELYVKYKGVYFELSSVISKKWLMKTII